MSQRPRHPRKPTRNALTPEDEARIALVRERFASLRPLIERAIAKLRRTGELTVSK